MNILKKTLKKPFIVQHAPIVKAFLDNQSEFEGVLKVRTEKYGIQIISIEVNRKDYDVAIEDYLLKIEGYVQEVLDFAKENKIKLTGITFVGGSTKDPFIRKRIQKFCKIKKAHFIKPEAVVSMGASIKSGMEDVGFSKIVSSVINTISSPIGVTLVDGEILWVLSEGDPLPTRKSIKTSGVQPGQTNIAFSFVEASKMYFGLQELSGNYSVSEEIIVRGFKREAVIPQFSINVEIDENKIASVSITQVNTGVTKEINQLDVFSQDNLNLASDRKESLADEALEFAVDAVDSRMEIYDVHEQLEIMIEELEQKVGEDPSLASVDKILALQDGANKALNSSDDHEKYLWLYRIAKLIGMA